MSARVALYSGFYNEGCFAKRIIEAVLEQELRPEIWVIADDGSTDGTLKILRQFEERFDWIKVLTLPKKKEKDINTAGMAWNKALKYIRDSGLKFDFYGKLDGDMVLPKEYYEKVTDFMKKNPTFKIVSGRIYVPNRNHFVAEDGDPNCKGYLVHNLARGACFVCDGAFFEAIPLDYFPITCHENYLNSKARIQGYRGGCINTPAYQLRESNRNLFKIGQTLYYYNSNPVFYVLPFTIELCLHRQGGTKILKGYLSARNRRIKIKDPEERKFWMWIAPVLYNRVFERIRFLRTDCVEA